MTKDKFLSFIKVAIPYLAILFASIFPFISYFHAGIAQGDDQLCNLWYMGDLYYSIKAGHWGIMPTHIISGYFSQFIYLFYGCFPEYLTVLFALATEWMGVTLPMAMKIITVCSVFVSGLFTYWFVSEASHSKKAGLLVALFFVLFPYRIFDFLYRAAFSEGIAIGLIPVVFFGINRILHDEKPRVSGYLATIIGMALMVLSHPFTALLTGLAAILWILISIKNVIRIFKQKKTHIFLWPSLVLLAMMLVFYVIPMAQGLSSGLYNISNDGMMGTYPEWLIEGLGKTNSYSGILNFVWLNKYIENGTWSATNDSIFRWTIELILFGLSLIGTIVIDVLFEKNEKLAPWKTLAVFVVLFLPSLLFLSRIEVFFALAIYFIVYLIFTYGSKEKEKAEELTIKKALLDSKLWIAVISIVFAFTMLYSAGAWRIVPSIFLKAQYPFRFFILLGAGLLLLLAYLAKWARGRKGVTYGLMVLVATSAVILQGPVDKRIAYANDGNTIYTKVDEEFVKSCNTVGWNHEYVPSIYYDWEYVPSSPNSLFYKVRTAILANRPFPQEDNYFEPVFIEGDGEATLTYLNSPSVSFDVTVLSEEAKIQIAQFYYDGYEVEAVDSLGKKTVFPAENVDCLLAFSLTKGEYKVNVRFVGSASYRVGRVFFYISIPLTIGFGIFGYFLNKKEKEAKPLEDE